MKGREDRKVRADKKRDVKPTIPLQLHECISRLSYILSCPIKDIGESVCLLGIEQEPVMDLLAKEFRRDLRFSRHTLFRGDPYRTPVKPFKGMIKRRITIRFKQSDHDRLCRLSFALDVTPSKTTALLLDAAIRNRAVMDSFLNSHLPRRLQNDRMEQLKWVMNFIERDNPYLEQGWIEIIKGYYNLLK